MREVLFLFAGAVFFIATLLERDPQTWTEREYRSFSREDDERRRRRRLGRKIRESPVTPTEIARFFPPAPVASPTIPNSAG